MVPAACVGSAVAGPSDRPYAPAPMRPRYLVRHGALAAALALVVLAGVRPGLGPGEVRGLGPLPECRYDDIMTQPRHYADWSITLVDTILRVPRNYVPPDLVPVGQAGIAGHGRVRAVMIDDLRALTDAARAAGNPIGVASAYRSYDDQVATFAHWVSVDGYAGALRVSARPGHSEHQLGLAIDFRSDPPDATLTGSWAFTPAGRWMGQHAWAYGFIRSYPAKKQSVTCYAGEAWHYRYVGRDLAAAIHGSGLTIREYLWSNYTTAVVPLAPKPSTGPGQPGTPSAPASVEPASTPSPEGSTAFSQGASAPGAPTSAARLSAAPAVSPAGNAGPSDGSPVADLDPAVVTGLVVALIVVLGVATLLARRGRSGVGL
jgi:D-alanyl-D-alanine carboxypeptidase